MLELLVIITCLTILIALRRSFYRLAILSLAGTAFCVMAALALATVIGVLLAGAWALGGGFMLLSHNPHAVAVLILLAPILLIGIGLYMAHRPNAN